MLEVKPYLYFVCGRDFERLHKIKLNLDLFLRSRKYFPTKVFGIFIRGYEFECDKIFQLSEVDLERNANLLNFAKVEPLFASKNFNTINYFNIDRCTFVIGDALKITIGLIRFSFVLICSSCIRICLFSLVLLFVILLFVLLLFVLICSSCIRICLFSVLLLFVLISSSYIKICLA